MSGGLKNPYEASPLCIAQINPDTNAIVKSFFFMGNVPKAVLAAAQKAHIKGAKLDWPAKDADILKQHYGGNWRHLLSVTPPVTSDISFASNTQFFANLNRVIGGAAAGKSVAADLPASDLRAAHEAGLHAAHRSEDFDLFDDIHNHTIEQEYDDNRVISENWADSSDIPTYTNMAVYPEDTIFDIKLKLAAVSDIAIYRQHMFYYINDEGPVIPYNFTIDGAPIAIDWRQLRRAEFTSRSNVIAGLSIDNRLEERHEGIKIEAFDTFMRLSSIPGIKVTNIYFVDLFSVLQPIKSQSRPNDGLANVLKDRYQFDLLYYGCLIKYWPMLNSNAANTALQDPIKLSEHYPSLDINPTRLKERFKIEREIIDKAICWSNCPKMQSYVAAVTSISLKINPNSIRMRLSLRNIFDWLEVGGDIMAIKGRFTVDASLLPQHSGNEKTRQGDTVFVNVSKRHASSYLAIHRAAMDSFIGKAHAGGMGGAGSTTSKITSSLKESLIIAIPVTHQGSVISIVYLSIMPNAHIEALSEYREDRMTTFSEAKQHMIRVSTPIIKRIIAMGTAASPTGGVLNDMSNTKMITIGVVNVSMFWPHTLSSSGFKELKNKFHEYESAGIITIKPVQNPTSAGILSFTFKKGIIIYDQRVIDRSDAVIRMSGSTLNQYSWLTDSNVALKWAQLFQGRTVRIYHRVTDIKIEIVGAESVEFDMMRIYIYSLLDALLKDVKKIDAAAAAAKKEDTGEVKILRRLQEKDPLLYDLKRYGPDATVYSVLCQSGRQPIMYDESEVPATVKSTLRKGSKKITKYWNFTKQKPAYYECPNKEFPHLSFRSGEHPMGYCLPCCKKTLPSIGSRAAQTNEECLKNHKSSVEDDLISKHVLSYGKPVAVSRISEIPKNLISGLFINATPDPYTLCLVGVEQTTVSGVDAGFVYSLAYLLADDETSLDDVLIELASLATDMTDTYYSLGGGKGVLFASAAELSECILSTFVRREEGFSKFGPGGEADDCIADILTDLANYLFLIDIVVIDDTDPVGAYLRASSTIYIKSEFNSDRKFGLLMKTPHGVYPIAMLNPSMYLRTEIEHRWMVARRSFYIEPPPQSDEPYIEDGVAKIIQDVLFSQKNFDDIDLKNIVEYTNDSAALFKLTMLLINMKNLCWGAVLEHKTDGAGHEHTPGDIGRVVVPIMQSEYLISGTPLHFGARPDIKLPERAMNAFVVDINKWRSNLGRTIIESDTTLKNTSGERIGFISREGLYFVHDATAADISAATPAVTVPYDLRDIDMAITTKARDVEDSELTKMQIKAELKNNLYRLFLVEFSAEIRKGRNKEIRSKLVAIISATKYDVSESVSNLRRKLLEILFAFPDDLRMIREIISRAFVIQPKNPTEIIIESMNSTMFKFDQVIIEELQKKSHEDTVAEIKRMMSDHIEITSDVLYTEQHNIYTPCSEKSILSVACRGGKLMVPKERIDEMYDILAYDVHNKGKSSILSAISSGVFDPLDFIRRPGEHLTITM